VQTQTAAFIYNDVRTLCSCSASCFLESLAASGVESLCGPACKCLSMVFRSAVHTTKGGSAGEKAISEDPGPRTKALLPPLLRKEARVYFDPKQHDIYGAVVEILHTTGPILGAYPPDTEVSPLENYQLDARAFKKPRARQALNEAVTGSERFLTAFDRLLQEVVIPHMKARLVESGEYRAEDTCVFFYQRPPTLRLQPGPSEETGKRHRDAEYGHQDGEVNFWLPLTDYSMTRTALWVESEEGAGDFHPLDAEYGSMVAFHGTTCWHEVPANPSQYMRASLDFRVGVEACFDPSWVLRGTRASHNYQTFSL